MLKYKRGRLKDLTVHDPAAWAGALDDTDAPAEPMPPRDAVYTVSGLNQDARALLETRFPRVWVAGEVSNLSRPSSGHVYFSLKDAHAHIRCAFFQHRALLWREGPRHGQQLLAQGRISLYEARGDFQLIVETLEEAGAGALRQAYEALRLTLEQEGLFALAHKQPLPAFPRRIGVITSPTGAALRDILATLQRRCPALLILLYPVPVQGDEAAERIAQMIRRASARQECDVLLLVRGGGALEDLQAFNTEAVVRAIFDCPIPLVSGIGHETDVTLADFAADLRAPTPTAAAELASPDRLEWQQRLVRLRERLEYALQRQLAQQRQQLDGLNRRLERAQPQHRLRERAQRLDDLDQRLHSALHQRLTRAAQQLHSLTRQLHALSPLATLERGYAVVRRADTGMIVRQANTVESGEQVEILLHQGRLLGRIITTEQF